MYTAYDQKKNPNLSNSTLHDSFVFAIGIGNDPAYAEKLRKEFKISDKQVVRWTIEGFVKAKNVTNLNDLTYKKNFPGYMTVVEACVRHNDQELAQIYTNEIEAIDQKCEALCLIKKYTEAADLAAENNDLRMLRKINLLCVNGAMKKHVLTHISAVHERRKNMNV
uniref:Vps16_C domain-containing protein n=1 Tax=Panagrellus redivivus TaxID=6233 RepID=A0A7E4V6Z3_PANRE